MNWFQVWQGLAAEGEPGHVQTFSKEFTTSLILSLQEILLKTQDFVWVVFFQIIKLGHVTYQM